MNRSGISFITGFGIGVATCIWAVAARLRVSPNADDWAIALLLYPCGVALMLVLTQNALSFHLLKADIRTLRSRGVDIDLELKGLAGVGESNLRYKVGAFYLFDSIALGLGGYFVSSIFLAAYLILL